MEVTCSFEHLSSVFCRDLAADAGHRVDRPGEAIRVGEPAEDLRLLMSCTAANAAR